MTPIREPSSFHLFLLAVAAWLVPSHLRDEWLAEWTSELWYVLEPCHNPTRFCAGAFQDAAWLRLADLRPRAHRMVGSTSPSGVLALLASVAIGAALLAFRLPIAASTVHQLPVPVHLLHVLLALLLLPSVTHLAVSFCPEGEQMPTRAERARGLAFLSVKIALIVPGVFFGTVALVPLVAPAGLQPLAALVGYVLAFHWALQDQRLRCPVCLHRLAHPVQIGERSHIFLEWYGVELMCSRGHGLLHVSGVPTISFQSRQWLGLDASWRGLFSEGGM